MTYFGNNSFIRFTSTALFAMKEASCVNVYDIQHERRIILIRMFPFLILEEIFNPLVIVFLNLVLKINHAFVLRQ
jgi:hypothetical protein